MHVWYVDAGIEDTPEPVYTHCLLCCLDGAESSGYYYYYYVTVTYDVHQLYYMQTVFCPHQTTGHWNYTRQEARHGLVYCVHCLIKLN